MQKLLPQTGLESKLCQLIIVSQIGGHKTDVAVVEVLRAQRFAVPIKLYHFACRQRIKNRSD